MAIRAPCWAAAAFWETATLSAHADMQLAILRFSSTLLPDATAVTSAAPQPRAPRMPGRAPAQVLSEICGQLCDHAGGLLGSCCVPERQDPVPIHQLLLHLVPHPAYAGVLHRQT